MSEMDVVIGAWSPPSWAYNGFPQPAAEVETVSLDYVIRALDRFTASITEADSTPLGAAMHVAHMLVTLQGEDGLWPAQLNLRTGQSAGDGRSAAPVPLMRRLNEMLYSTEFDHSIGRAEQTAAQPM